MTTMEDFRQLAAERVTGRELINRMVGHLPDLQRIWVSTNDRQLAILCQDYPGFYRYATLMEEAAEAERANPRRTYLKMPELNDSLKKQLSALLTVAAMLERRYQSVIDSNRRGVGNQLDELNRLHRQWLADRERFVETLNEAGVLKIVLEVVMPALDQMADRIAQLKKRVLAG